MTTQNSEARLLIDEKIGDYPSGQFKSQNALAPISKLPPEILSIIFYFIFAEQTRHSLSFHCYDFTQVSRSWRDVALNAPELWQVLITTNLKRATTFLERSKGADLTVIQPSCHSALYPARISFLKDVLESHTSRIRHLELTETDPPSLSSLFEHVQPLSLRLYSLKLDFIFLNFGATFPSGIIDTQCLRTLDVGRCEGPWYSLSFPALTSLRLYHISNPLCLSKFLDMLRALGPRLTSLDMKDSFPVAGDSVRPVRLPNLLFFRLVSTTNPRVVSNILSSIIVPPTATLDIYVGYRVDTTSQGVIIAELIPSLRKFFSHLGHRTYRNFDVESSRIYPFYLQAWENDECISTPDLKTVLYLRPMEMWASQDTVQPVLLSHPLSGITTLTLSLEFSPVDSSLRNTFGRLPCLETVQVVVGRLLDFLDALTYKPENYNTEASAYYSVTFPALRCLRISKNWSCRDCPWPNEELLDCLIERCERRAGLWNLKLTDCDNVCPEDVESLREIVVDVEWRRDLFAVKDRASP